MKKLLEERTTAGVHEKIMRTTVWPSLHVKFAAAIRYRGVCIVPSRIVASRAYIATNIIAANARQPWLVDARCISNFSPAATIST
jgi:hypothetical protein